MARKRTSKATLSTSETDVSLESETEGKFESKSKSENGNGNAKVALEALERSGRVRKAGIGKQACSGHIESIELIDFMCHRHLLITLNSHINFIVGNNGSGKSAILTALTVCLGGRASSTQRATNVDTLIREGAQSGKVKVKLYNQGDNPYMPEIYDEHIIIERSFKREGSNSYAIYGGSGRLIAGRKEEVNSICDHFGIQVDNPLAVLTQETAKRFLANSKPKELYEFFMKATQLEQLSIDYAFALDKIKESKIRLEQSKNALQPFRNTISQLEGQLEDLERLKATHQNIRHLRGELTWAMVEQREREFQKIVKGLENRRIKVINLQEKIGDAKVNYEKLENQIKEMESSITGEQAKLSPLLQQRTELTNEISSYDQSLDELSMDAKQINRELSELRSQLEDLNLRLIQEANRRVDGRQESSRNRHKELDEELIKVNGHVYDERALENSLTTKVMEVRERLALVSQKRGEVERSLEANRRLILSLEQCKGDRVRAFNERMPDALTEIRRNSNLFEKDPVGPAGLHIKLKDKRWTLALEAIMHSNVEAFIVDNHRDRNTLHKILQKHGLENPIVVLHFRGNLDIASGIPDAQFLTALDVLEIDNVIVRKMLIILSQIESNVLIEDRHQALQVMRQRPRNVTAVYTSNARINAGPKSISVTQLFSNNRRPRLLEDSEAQIRELEEKLEGLIVAKGKVDRENATINSELQGLLLDLEKSRLKADELERRARAIKNETRQIQDELRDQETISESVFEQEKKETEERIKTTSAQYQANHEQEAMVIIKKAKYQEQLTNLDININKIRSVHEGIIEDISKCVRMRKNIERDLDKLEKERMIEEAAVTLEESNKSTAKVELDQMREAAGNICVRVHVSRSIQELDRELCAQESCIARNEQSQMDPLQIKADLESKRKQYKNAEESIIVNERLVKALNVSLDQRQRAWEDFRRSVSKMSSTEFIFMLTARGFQGSLEYRHHDGELHIRVIPQGQQDSMTTTLTSNKQSNFDGKRRKIVVEGGGGGGSIDENDNNRDVRQLSGGEKSYSTACFLFSLWQAMGSPLRCLDEFDVYMDPVNRNYILELLVSHARASKVQFILITPNTIPDSYRSATDVRIFRLRDPERGQTTLF